MYEWITITNIPEGAMCNCWQGLTLPIVESPSNGDKILGAFSHQEVESVEDGFIVPTPRALLILVINHGLSASCCAKICFSIELFPYLFFPANCCIISTQTPEFEHIMA